MGPSEIANVSGARRRKLGVRSLILPAQMPPESLRQVSLVRHRKHETKTLRIARRSAGKPTTPGHALSLAA
jgi:hypothetical protein